MKSNYLAAGFLAAAIVSLVAGIVYGEIEGAIFAIAAGALGLFVISR